MNHSQIEQYILDLQNRMKRLEKFYPTPDLPKSAKSEKRKKMKPDTLRFHMDYITGKKHKP